MKRFEITLPLLAFVVAILASAFSLPGKADSPNASLYWYVVTYNAQHPNGAVLSSSDFVVQDDRDNVISPCDPGANLDCLRGFTSPLTSFPNASGGTEQITKP